MCPNLPVKGQRESVEMQEKRDGGVGLRRSRRKPPAQPRAER